MPHVDFSQSPPLGHLPARSIKFKASLPVLLTLHKADAEPVSPPCGFTAPKPPAFTTGDAFKANGQSTTIASRGNAHPAGNIITTATLPSDSFPVRSVKPLPLFRDDFVKPPPFEKLTTAKNEPF
jgi:hypothetical protein